MLLQTKGIDVNKWVRIMLPTTSLPRPYPLLINLLAAASAKGHSEIVAMLLQTKGIDVNQGVRLMNHNTFLCLILILLPLTPITIAVICMS